MDVGNSFGMVETYLPLHIIALRLLIAAVLGAMIGFERDPYGAGWVAHPHPCGGGGCPFHHPVL